MAPPDRNESGTFAETVSLDDVRTVFDTVRGPVVTSSDVAEQWACTTDTARTKLAQLYDRNEVEKRKTAGVVLYWPVDPHWHPDSDNVHGSIETSLDGSSATDTAPAPDPIDSDST